MERTTAFGWLNALGTSGSQTRSVVAFGRRGLKIVPALVTAIVLGFGSPANAQVLPWPNLEVAPPWNAQQIFEPSPLPKLTDPDTREDIPPEDTPVKGRLQPGYEPVGIRSGSWMFNPSLITGGFFDSNVFASNTDIRGDFAAVVEPSLRAHTLWERHGIDLKLDAQETVYKQNSSLNQTNASLKGNGWIDIAHDMALLTSFQVAHFNEGVGSLSSPANAIAPTPYNWYSGDVTFRKEFNRLTTSVGFSTDSYDFGSTRAQNGTIISQDARDGQIYALHSRIDYAFSETLGWFAGAEGNVRDLRGLPGAPLDSQGYRALTGVTIGLTRLITGEFGVGYVQQRFVDPTIGTIEGPTYRARLTWSPTRMIDVHFNAEQLVTQTSDTSATGVLANAVQLGLDYELRRNVIVSLAGAYESDRFFGQVRKDQVTTSDARVKYLLNRFAAIAVYYRFTSRESNVSTFSYDKHLVGLNVTTQF
ncbi:outer membrane beta-barrel protein [Bradyrhizobium cenepequi]|uniref:outer membrane beta-barrel protein n=1 Tax=Bradyrhizobium cenepequi TaxID=2821403 RepID=UPI001CE34EED|nr:outer membrane beta-barrel protein [Bradyrhizobium cenepequi]MCA6106557.1 outer membrane beta-barrel protein [Bradyrhizobium cenepequi]